LLVGAAAQPQELTLAAEEAALRREMTCLK
jgi:hypothetical protein